MEFPDEDYLDVPSLNSELGQKKCEFLQETVGKVWISLLMVNLFLHGQRDFRKLPHFAS